MNRSEIKLNTIIMRTIGLAVSGEGLVVDQDLIGPIKYRGKLLTTNTMFDRRQAVPFCPLSDLNLMKCVFDHFLYKQGMFFDEYYPIMYPYMENGMNIIGIKNQDGKEFKSTPYHNLVLAYMELMLILAEGTDIVDLHLYDNTSFYIPALKGDM